MVLIVGGEFDYGALPSDAQALKDEKPQRRVRVEAFYLDVSEVTRAQFARFVRETGHTTQCERDEPCSMFSSPPAHEWENEKASWKRPANRLGASSSDPGDDPVTFVSWTDAMAYCKWAGASLPTERQFEFVLRNRGNENLYPWGGSDVPPRNHGNYLGDEFAEAYPLWKGRVVSGYSDRFIGVAPVRSFGADRFGLYDISGNVGEWCLNAFTTSLDRTEADERADGYKIHRVLRGGSWYAIPVRLRCSWRTQSSDHDARAWWGFRCAAPAPLPSDLQHEVVRR